MRRFIAVCVALVLLGLLGVWLGLNSIIRSGIETFGPKALGVPVTVEAVAMSPFSGKGAIKGLVIGNPEGFEMESAFELAEVRFGIEPGSLLSDVIVVDEIHIKGPKVTYEITRKGSNIRALMRNVQSFAGSEGKGNTKQEKGEKKAAGPSKKIRIKSFEFLGGKALVKAPMLKQPLDVKVPDLRLKDIGGKEGTTPGKAAAQVLGVVTKSVIKAAGGARSGLGDAVDTARDTAGKAFRKLKGLFGK